MEKDLDRIARKRAGAKLGFYIHAAVFVAMNLALFALNGQLTPAYRLHGNGLHRRAPCALQERVLPWRNVRNGGSQIRTL